jgi:hypothetical protein
MATLQEKLDKASEACEVILAELLDEIEKD